MKTAVWILLVIVAVLVAAACWLWEMVRDEREQKRKAELELSSTRNDLLVEKNATRSWKSRALCAEEALLQETSMRERVHVYQTVTDEVIESVNIDVVPYVKAELKRMIAEAAMDYVAIESRRAPGGGGLQIVGTLQLRKPDAPGRIEDYIREYWEELRRGSAVEGCHGGQEEEDLLRTVHGNEAQEGTGSAVSEGTEGERAEVM